MSSKTVAAQRQEQHYHQQHDDGSSINKHVMDKAASLIHYKSPDLLAPRSGAPIAGRSVRTLMGSKYYTPVYSRTGNTYTTPSGVGVGGAGAAVGGVLRAVPTAALAVSVLQHTSNESAGSRPVVMGNAAPAAMLPSNRTLPVSAAPVPASTAAGGVAKSTNTAASMTNPSGQPIK